ARGRRFSATVSGYSVECVIEPLSGEGEILRHSESILLERFPVGRVTDVEFRHVDQALEVRLAGQVVARMEYDWSPVERLTASTTLTDEQLEEVLSNPHSTALSNGRNTLGVY